MDNHYDIPILYLIFNRTDLTEITFQRIREIRPQKLFVAADGPRPDKSGEEMLCKNTRKFVLENIDWECEVKTLFRDNNLGCGKAVSSAIDWFFENVDMGIILEDDIVPDLSFFKFCSTILNEYKDDSRVMMVSGHNHLGEWMNNKASYFFSQLGAIWGWATWKRAWDLNSRDINTWISVKEQRIYDKIFLTKEQSKYRTYVTEMAQNGTIDTWDYIWTMNRLANSGLSVIPSVNLISNIGFSDSATHTKINNLPSKALNTKSIDFSQFTKAKFIYADLEYDLNIFKEFVHNSDVKIENKITMPRKLINKFKNKINHYLDSNHEQVSRQNDRFFFEQKGYFNIASLLNSTKSYLPFSDSSLSFGTISCILNDILINKRDFIVELGSGISTILISKLIKENNLSARILSFDNNSEWISILSKINEVEGTNEFCELIHAPLKSFNGLWYNQEIIKNSLTDKTRIECLIIDGPEAWEIKNKYSRIHALEVLYHNLAGDFSIFLDDIDREGEKKAITEWEKTYNLQFQSVNESFAVAFQGENFNIFL